ncbi:response regulator [Pedobacter caeni]|uniref:histidine kinase n=1 Tax=Pedobacter caeni TaxID=288992 RepID=A0A1M5IWG8_9SPHI|nr:response regulator [Pedobacter caeni]SHG32409.1 His Kinase A (phospho-acceptor) domain-containing protein [Pedobacter caeni]
MQSFADFSNNYLTAPDLAFFNKLLQFQSAYYSTLHKDEVLEQLLSELCEVTQSNSAGLINNNNRLGDVFVNNGQVGLLHATLKKTGNIPTKEYQIKKIGEQSMLICSIRDGEGVVGLLYFIRSGPPFTAESYGLIKSAIPVLSGILAYMNLSGKMVPELNMQLKRTASLQALIESLDDIILELDENTVIKKVWVKDKTKLFMPPELFIDKSLTEVMGGFAYVFIECIQELLITGERQECVYPDFDINKDLWYCAKFQKIDAGKDEEEIRVICVIEDITAKKLMSDQLQQNTVELKRINNLLDIGLDISKMGGWEYHLYSRELFVTRQINDIKDLNHEFVLNYKSILDYFDHDNKLILLNTLNEAFKESQPFDLELELTSAIKNKKWVRIAGVPVLENGTVQSFRGILKDITHNKKSQEELIAAKNLAEQVARKRTEILSIMSHEIRTPLNGIIGICNLLSQTDFPDLQVKEYVDHLSFSSNHLLNLVNDILDLEKIENKKVELHETEGDLSFLVGNIVKQFQSMAELKGLELKFHTDQHIPGTIVFDELRLGRILNNLIGNAIKFTEKGEVVVELKATAFNEERVKVRFKVKDTGIGIPEHLHNLVFDKFHQVQQASHRQQQGTGLGLSITKGLVSLFNSEIFLSSKVNEGTVFEFEIEFMIVKKTELRKVLKGEAHSRRILPELKLLIVDDHPVNLLVAKRQLGNFGIEAEQADNGYTALAMLNTMNFDIILIDLHMPGMDGYQLARKVQVDYPQTKVIIFTADILEEVRMRLAEMGILYVLSKPFNPDEMHQLLLEVINNKS